LAAVGTYYDRLTKVAELDYGDADEQALYEKLFGLIENCKALAKSYQDDPGLEGKTAATALAWLADYQTRLQAQADALSAASTAHDSARAAMVQAKADHAKLSPNLLTNYEMTGLAIATPLIVLSGQTVTAAVFLAKLAMDREAERETAAKTALVTMNASVKAAAADITLKPPGAGSSPTVPSSSGSGSGSGGSSAGSSSAGSGSAGSGSAGSGSARRAHVVSRTTTTTSPASAYQPVASAVPNDPASGYEPPSVQARQDPRWRESYTYTPTTSATSAAIVGGVLGLGSAALGARALSSLSTATAMGSGSANALSQLGAGTGSTSRAPGGGMLSNNARGAGMGAAQNAARGGNTGKSSRDGSKKKRKPARPGYRLAHGDENVAVGTNPGAGAGSADRLDPIASIDQEERW
jgi:hypothetical protein